MTEELAVWPPEASFERGDFDARISLSTVNEPGPFSEFPGCDRVLVVTRGGGLRLSHGSYAPPADLARLQPFLFQGEGTTTAELPNGPVDDFNVIVRRGRMVFDVEVLLEAHAADLGDVPLAYRPPSGAGSDALVHVPLGHVLLEVTGQRGPLRLGPRESLLVRGAAPSDVLRVIPASVAGAATGVVLLVRLARA